MPQLNEGCRMKAGLDLVLLSPGTSFPEARCAMHRGTDEKMWSGSHGY